MATSSQPLTDFFPRPSLTEPKEASRSIGTRYEGREQSFDGRLIALQDMHYADFAEDDVSLANIIPSKQN